MNFGFSLLLWRINVEVLNNKKTIQSVTDLEIIIEEAGESKNIEYNIFSYSVG